MKQTLIHILLAIFLLSACTQEEAPMAYGYLQIDGIELSCDGEVLPISRAVDAGLQVQICRDGQVLPEHDYAPGSDFSSRIKLVAGTYTVKAFTPDQAEAANDATGHPVYSITSDAFAVEDGDLTTVSLIASQINVGVNVTFGETFLAAFTDVSVKVTSTSSGREVTVDAIEAETYYYFNLPSDGKLTYTVSATNGDGEPFNLSKDINAISAKNYTIQIAVE